MEKCLLDSPGGKCVFEHLQSLCQREIAEVLTCARVAMEEKLKRVLNPPFSSAAPPAGVGGGEAAGDEGGAAAWAAEAQRLQAWAEEEEEAIGLLDWALEGDEEPEGSAPPAVELQRDGAAPGHPVTI